MKVSQAGDSLMLATRRVVTFHPSGILCKKGEQLVAVWPRVRLIDGSSHDIVAGLQIEESNSRCSNKHIGKISPLIIAACAL